VRLDVAKNLDNKSVTGVLSKCKVCGRTFTWECPTELVYFDIKKGKKIATVEPEHCGSSVCTDFWGYYEQIRQKAAVDFDYARVLYLKRKGMM